MLVRFELLGCELGELPPGAIVTVVVGGLDDPAEDVDVDFGVDVDVCDVWTDSTTSSIETVVRVPSAADKNMVSI